MHSSSLQKTLDPITIAFWVDGLPPSPNQMKGAHWTKVEKSKKLWMAKVYYAASDIKRSESLKGLYESCDIHFEIQVGDNRRRDPDNLIWAVCKPTLDSLTGVLIEDDNFDAIKLSFSFSRERPKGFKVTLTGN